MKKANGTENKRKNYTKAYVREKQRKEEQFGYQWRITQGECIHTKKKSNSSIKEKEIAKYHAENEAANNLFKVHSVHYYPMHHRLIRMQKIEMMFYPFFHGLHLQIFQLLINCS